MRRLVVITAVLMLLGFTAYANATLVNNGGGLIYDSDLNITWYDFTYQVAPGAGTQWQPAMNWASALTVGDTTAGSWGLPAADAAAGFVKYVGQMGHLYHTELGLSSSPGDTYLVTQQEFPFVNLLDATYWTKDTYFVRPSDGVKAIYTMDFTSGQQSDSWETSNLYAVAVHAGDVGAPVAAPEPATLLLLASGLVGMVGLGWRKN
jgi:hypothetical protein